MMIRINSMRFQNIVNNYIEILNDLEEDCCLKQESDFVPLKDPRGFKNFPVASLCKSHEFVTVFC